MARKWVGFGIAVAIVFSVHQTLAGEPTVIVEDVSPNVAGVEFMGYLEPGRTFTLGPGKSATLGYVLNAMSSESASLAKWTDLDSPSELNGG